jgi:hypothetical protein
MLALLGGGLVIIIIIIIVVDIHGTDVSDKDDTDYKRGTISHHFCCNSSSIFSTCHSHFFKVMLLSTKNNASKRTFNSKILTFHNKNNSRPTSAICGVAIK